MDVYTRTGRLKLYLAILGIFFLIIPLFYANYLAQNLAIREKTHVEILVKTLQFISNNSNNDDDLTYQSEILEKLNDSRVVTINQSDEIQLHNYSEPADTASILARVKRSNITPLTSPDYKAIYFEYPKILTLISYFPLLQLLLLLFYITIAYAVFNLSRKEEQNRVWVGMAKETAHQLGTPISGIMGWLDNLRESGISDDEQREIMNHMEMDITKLQQVSDRFSKIGSIPELQKKSLPEELQRSLIYMKARASSKIDFKLIFDEDQFYFAMINSNLFSWVIENVIRNALDAMDGQGFITIRLVSIHHVNHIEIEDNGKGIPSSKFNTIFRPGYSTKSRGWGLGLSLAKRIIENYHNGKIYVKSSVEGEGTTITIQLPSV